MAGQTPPNIFSPDKVRAHRDRAVGTFGEFDFLKRRLSSDLIARLGDVARRFPHALDLGCHTGQASHALMESGQVDHVTALDLSPKMVDAARQTGVDAVAGALDALPFADNRFDLAVSIASLHWVNDLPGTLVQLRRCLKPDGLFLGALYGGHSLIELRRCLTEAEAELTGGAAARVSPFLDGLDAGALLQRAGLALPVADTDTLTIRYDTILDMVRDLRGMGETSALTGDPPPRLRLDVLARAQELYSERFADADGRLPVRVDVVWMSGWSPAPSQPKPLKPGSAKVRLADALGQTEIKTGDMTSPRPADEDG